MAVPVFQPWEHVQGAPRGTMLIIAEKPSMGRSIAEALGGRQQGSKTHIEGEGWTVTWAVGHLFELPMPEDFIPNGYVMKDGKRKRKPWEWSDLEYMIPADHSVFVKRPKKDTEDQLKAIERLARNSSLIVHAGDPDREGQAIVDDILAHVRWRGPVRRLWLLSLDKATVQDAFQNMAANDDYRPMGTAALARSIADWLVGMPLSRAYTLQCKDNGGDALLTVGRVQTPTLALVVERERERANFRAVDYFLPWIDVLHQAGRFRANWLLPIPNDKGELPWKGAMGEFPGLDPENRLVDRSVAERYGSALSSARWGLTAYREQEKADKPPLPYNLTDLQADANRLFGMTAKQVLDATQSLYDDKILSYPRSECSYMPENMHEEAPEILRAIATHQAYAQLAANADPTIVSPAWDNEKVEAHYGITPRPGCGRGRAMERNEERIFDLVVRRYLAQFYPDRRWVAQMAVVDGIIGGGEFEGVHRFRADGRIPVHPGWSVVMAKGEVPAEEGEEDEAEPVAAGAIPRMNSGDPIQVQGNGRDQKRTSPPASFTEGTLLKAMKAIHRFVKDPEVRRRLRDNDGIGTTATRDRIIEGLIKHELLARSKKKLIPTQAGEALYDAISPDVRDPGTTAVWESGLSRIEEGKIDLGRFLDLIVSFVRDKVQEARAANLNVSGGSRKGGGKAGGGGQNVEPLPGDGMQCPACGQGQLKTRVSRNAKPGSDPRFLSCNRFSRDGDGCSYIHKSGGGGQASRSQVPELEGHGQTCPACQTGVMLTRMVQKDGPNKGKRFLACNGRDHGCNHAVYPESEWPPKPKRASF